MSDPIVKDGRVDSPTFLAWTRRQRCRALEAGEETSERADCAGPIDPHHVDGKGMGGARCRDDRVIPLCRKHHDEAHGETRGIVLAMLLWWADEARCRFLDNASNDEIDRYVQDLKRWRDRPLACPF